MAGCIPCNECTNYGEETACLSPLNLAFENLTTTSVSLSWEGSANVLTYNVEFKESTSLTWNVLVPVIASVNIVTIIGLTPDTTYDFRVNGVCATSSCYSLTVRKKTCPLEA
jgi:hypothetical protein